MDRPPSFLSPPGPNQCVAKRLFEDEDDPTEYLIRCNGLEGSSPQVNGGTWTFHTFGQLPPLAQFSMKTKWVELISLDEGSHSSYMYTYYNGA